MSEYMRVTAGVSMSICPYVRVCVSMSVCLYVSMWDYVSMFINQSMPKCIRGWFKPSEGLLTTWKVVCRSTALTFPDVKLVGLGQSCIRAPLPTFAHLLVSQRPLSLWL